MTLRLRNALRRLVIWADLTNFGTRPYPKHVAQTRAMLDVKETE